MVSTPSPDQYVIPVTLDTEAAAWRSYHMRNALDALGEVSLRGAVLQHMRTYSGWAILRRKYNLDPRAMDGRGERKKLEKDITRAKDFFALAWGVPLPYVEAGRPLPDKVEESFPGFMRHYVGEDDVHKERRQECKDRLAFERAVSLGDSGPPSHYITRGQSEATQLNLLKADEPDEKMVR